MSTTDPMKDKIQTLPLITIKGLEKKDYVNVVRFNGRLYCIDDPRLLEDAKGIVVVGEVDNEKRLWHSYIANNLKNRLNIVQLLILYHKGIITLDAIPAQIQHIVDNTKDIPIELLNNVQELINELETKGNPILVDETITYGIKRFIDILKEAGIDEKRIYELLIDTLNKYRTTELDIVRLSTARGLELIAEEYVRRLRLRLRLRKRRKVMVTVGDFAEEGEDVGEDDVSLDTDVNVDRMPEERIPIPLTSNNAGSSRELHLDGSSIDCKLTSNNAGSSSNNNDISNADYSNYNNYNYYNNYTGDIVTYTIRITGKREYVEQVINILNEMAVRYNLHIYHGRR